MLMTMTFYNVSATFPALIISDKRLLWRDTENYPNIRLDELKSRYHFVYKPTRSVCTCMLRNDRKTLNGRLEKHGDVYDFGQLAAYCAGQ